MKARAGGLIPFLPKLGIGCRGAEIHCVPAARQGRSGVRDTHPPPLVGPTHEVVTGRRVPIMSTCLTSPSLQSLAVFATPESGALLTVVLGAAILTVAIGIIRVVAHVVVQTIEFATLMGMRFLGVFLVGTLLFMMFLTEKIEEFLAR